MKIVQLSNEVAVLEDFARWVEYRSGRGEIGLSLEQYNDEVDRGDWQQEDVD